MLSAVNLPSAIAFFGMIVRATAAPTFGATIDSDIRTGVQAGDCDRSLLALVEEQFISIQQHGTAR